MRGMKTHTASPGSGVVEASQEGGRVDAVRAGENVGLDHILAITITTRLTVVFRGRHCSILPRLRWKRVLSMRLKIDGG